MTHVNTGARLSWWERVRTFEPALLRAVVTAAVIVLGLVGVNATEWGDKIVTGWEAIFVVIPLVQAWWTRGAVTPNAKVYTPNEKVRVNGL